ncbi:hypothetical protein HZB02_02585 [Candidatus Woesearchaeota archaeon]|nr:hypothetical protein [Candidatus Woesearchaeota archaeon]
MHSLRKNLSDHDSNLKHLLSLVKGKQVSLATHWDCDGVVSGALMYHLLKKEADAMQTISKGDVFLIHEKDINPHADVIVCVDIQPSEELDASKVIYIDHHPLEKTDDFLFAVHDPSIQSCSLLIWDKLLRETKDPYYVFLALLGYFGDGGKRENIPPELFSAARELIPELMQAKHSSYNGGYYFEIEKYVSTMNVGKRMHWSGEVPLALLKSITKHEPFTQNSHPLAQELAAMKMELRQFYAMDVDFKETKDVLYGMIQCSCNVQGVLCARYMRNKPVMILNQVRGMVIGSMRVPDHIDFDAGTYLEQFNGKIPSFLGGGHEKAGGFTLKQEDLDRFMELLQKGY